ncbi:DUF2508 family protein [Brevibacillus centrosporus]|uniref:DUF2508 family protein n=1 Tax=Brevibacillus centrosporus TaxID=54910 RepID=UPI002E1A2868|nr:DUF2508 family protein [Brevibacillus centrosporus]
MSRWGKKTRILIDVDAGGLDAAVNQARLDWQHARHLVEISEPDGGLDDAIYYLQLTEKRYMYLLSQAKREHHRKRA